MKKYRVYAGSGKTKLYLGTRILRENKYLDKGVYQVSIEGKLYPVTIYHAKSGATYATILGRYG